MGVMTSSDNNKEKLMLADNAALSPLKRFHLEALKKGLEGVQTGNKIIEVGLVEYCAKTILDRVFEIDNAFPKVDLAIEYLKKNTFESSKYGDSEHLSYHMENLIIKMLSITDKCWLLIGSSFLLNAASIEKISGRKKIENTIKDHPEIKKTIQSIVSETQPFKDIRNKIAHGGSYSNIYLTYMDFIKNDNSFSEIISEKELKEIFSTEVLTEITEAAQRLYKKINNLINSMSELYLIISQTGKDSVLATNSNPAGDNNV